MRFLGLALVLLIALIQNPLWFGKGGWLRVHELDAQVEAQRETNTKHSARPTRSSRHATQCSTPRCSI